ncbi:helix-turn-helix domain-containing protein [Patescibacteria group bacterium]|jgi:transposase-like protein|nr:helix-turn-helix domain-containing protein [Patescibacteria group bacterium]MCL5114303.1 helix-turn-helix domain-containing protein [Patescibacteria group bacterium]
MRKDKEQALKLRLSGKSYAEISRELGIPKATLSDWFSQLILPPFAQQKIQKRTRERSLAGLLNRNKNQTALAIRRRDKTRSRAQKMIGNISRRELLLIGTALYWAEGYKRTKVKNGRELTHHPVSLTNSDPNLIKLFLRFLREICNVPETKIHADVRIYEHLNEKQLLEFWSRTTNIRKEKFSKFYYGISKSSLGKRPFNILPFGTIQIRVNDTKLFHTIMGWIEGLRV